MPPYLALLLWFILLLGIFWFDPAKEPKVSAALWVPLTYMFFMASRQPTQWISGQVSVSTAAMADSLEQGDPLNRTVSVVLLFLGIAILVSRSFRWGNFLRHNSVLTAYVLFALVSVVWSDFPFPAFKKWFRDLANYVMVLVVISDPFPLEAVSTLLRRVGYLLVPLSVVLIKYFPGLARQYDPWTGGVTFSGATTTKNMLGILCLVCGIYFFWDTVVRWSHRKDRRYKRVILVNAVMTCLTWWLLITCNSATSRTCLIIAYLVILADSQQSDSTPTQNSNRYDTNHFPGIHLVILRTGFNGSLRRGRRPDFAVRPSRNLAHRSQPADESAPGGRIRELLAGTTTRADLDIRYGSHQ